MLAQPAFGALDAHARFLLRFPAVQLAQVAVEKHQRAVPFLGEAALDQLAGERRFAERQRAPRRRRRDARVRLVGRRDAPQARFQRAAVARVARQQLDVRLHAVLLGDRRRDRAALGEQRGKPEHLLPVLRPALGAQQHARGGDVPRPGAVQAAQRIARAHEVALLERSSACVSRRAACSVSPAAPARSSHWSRRSNSRSWCAARAAISAASPGAAPASQASAASFSARA